VWNVPGAPLKQVILDGCARLVARGRGAESCGVAYPVAVRRFVLLAAISIVLLGCGESHAVSRPEPSWVVAGVKTLRAYFVGTPKPETVTWGHDSKSRWVTVLFRTTETCAPCHGKPIGATGLVAGRRATITWAAGGPSFFTVRIQKR